MPCASVEKSRVEVRVGDAMASKDAKEDGDDTFEALAYKFRHKRKKKLNENEDMDFFDNHMALKEASVGLEDMSRAVENTQVMGAEMLAHNSTNNNGSNSNENFSEGTAMSSTLNTNTNTQTADANREQLLYPASHKGKAWVLFDTSKSEIIHNKKVRNGLYLWSKIKNCNMVGIDTIKSIGITFYKVLFENAAYANECVKRNMLNAIGIRTFIPRNFIETFGVIRDIPTEYSEAEIRDGISSVIQVSSVQRFTRRESKESDKRVPTLSVKIGFLGDCIPKEVILDHTILEVDNFFPRLRQCYNCGKIGHTQKACRSIKRCLKCGKTEGCINNILCGDAAHIAFDRALCPIWEKEDRLNKIMTLKKQSRKEVLKEINAASSNRFELLSEDHFPELKVQENPLRDNQKEE